MPTVLLRESLPLKWMGVPALILTSEMDGRPGFNQDFREFISYMYMALYR